MLSIAAKHSFFVRYALSQVNHSRFRGYLFDPQSVVLNAPNSPDTERGHFGELGIRALESLVRFNTTIKERGGALVIVIIPPVELLGLQNGNNMKTAVKAHVRVSDWIVLIQRTV
jgi:hypothetical protein